MIKSTILLPNFNNEKYLEECFQSIINQSLKEFEVVMVDDGSTDNSQEILKKIADSDDRFKLIIKSENSGIVETLNIGLDQVKTEYVIRMDGDDLMHPERIEILQNFMDQHPDIDVCGSGIKLFGEIEGEVLYTDSPVLNIANLVFGHSFGHASCIMRTNFLREKAGGYTSDYPLMEDYDLAIRTKGYAKITSIKDVLYYYRQTDVNALNNNDKKKGTFLRIYRKILDELNISYQDSEKIHFEISKNVELNYSSKEYIKHFKLLIDSNKKLKIYPIQEFNAVVNDYREQMMFRLIDNKKAKFGQVFPNMKGVKYYLSKKIKRGN